MKAWHLRNRREEILSLYESGLSSTDISRKLQVSEQSILYHLRRANVRCRKNRIHFFEESYFSTIDSEDKAYWLGFIAADGNIHNNSLSICLSFVDKTHLEKFQTSIQSKAKLKHRQKPDSWRLVLSSKRLCSDLNSLGITPAKSLTLRFPKIPTAFEKFFIRGYFDGDGWITQRKNNLFDVGIVSGSAEFIKNVHQIIGFGKISQPKQNDNRLMFYAKRDIKSLFDYIYANPKIYLERKWQKIQQFYLLHQ